MIASKFALDDTAGQIAHSICLKLKSGEHDLEYEPCLSLTGTTSNLVESEDNGVYSFRQGGSPGEPMQLQALF